MGLLTCGAGATVSDVRRWCGVQGREGGATAALRRCGGVVYGEERGRGGGAWGRGSGVQRREGREGSVRAACSWVRATCSGVRAVLLRSCCGVRAVCGQRKGGVQPA